MDYWTKQGAKKHDFLRCLTLGGGPLAFLMKKVSPKLAYPVLSLQTCQLLAKLLYHIHFSNLTAGGPRVLEVAALADKRGPAKVAQTLYIDHTPPPPPTGHMPGDPTFDRGSRKGRKGARPTKRDRRRFTPDKSW